MKRINTETTIFANVPLYVYGYYTIVSVYGFNDMGFGISPIINKEIVDAFWRNKKGETPWPAR